MILLVICFQAFGFDVGRFDNVSAWYQRCKEDLSDSGYEEINVSGAKMLGDIFRSR